jgi:hypothetical protein
LSDEEFAHLESLSKEFSENSLSDFEKHCLKLFDLEKLFCSIR